MTKEEQADAAEFAQKLMDFGLQIIGRKPNKMLYACGLISEVLFLTAPPDRLAEAREAFAAGQAVAKDHATRRGSA